MPTLSRLVGTCLLCAGLSLVVPPTAGASEESERLVAQGELAYQEGRYADAAATFRRATEADPDDPAAAYATGLALGKLGQWEPACASFERALALDPGFPDAQSGLDLARARTRESGGRDGIDIEASPEDELVAPTSTAAPKRWSVYANTGWEYDSNPQIAPNGDVVAGLKKEGDSAFVAAAGGRFDLANTARTLLRLEYDFYEALYVKDSDVDFQSHRVRATGSYGVLPWLWAGVQTGYTYAFYGPHSYLSEPFVMPFTSFLERSWGLSQVYYRFAEASYLSTPFRGVLTGPLNAVGLSQTLYQGARSLTFGWEYGTQVPRSSRGDDYDQRDNEAYVGVGIPLPWQLTVDLTYLFRYENYTKPNSQSASGARRHDAVNYVYAALGRAIGDHASVALAYYGTFDHSNIPAYTYDRNIVAATLQLAF